LQSIKKRKHPRNNKLSALVGRDQPMSTELHLEMNMLKVSRLLFFTALLMIAVPAFADEVVAIKAGYQLLTPDGSIAGNDNGSGAKLDAENDLNWDDSEDLLLDLALQWGDSRLSFTYMPIEFSGSNTLNFAGSYNGQNFNVGERVTSAATIDLYDIGYTYYLINMDDLPSRFQLGIELALKVADIDVKFADSVAESNSSDSIVAVLPTLGIRTRIALADLVGLSARVGYVEYNENHFLDADIQLEYSPVPNAGIFIGYRFYDLEVDEQDIYVSLELSGPYVGLMIRF